MFSQSADEPAADQSPAPIGMRELPPQPAKPVMPVYTMPSPSPAGAEPAGHEIAAGPDDSVIARDDHVEGTFTSRGTVVVMGSLKGRIESVRVRIEDGARVEADVIVDEAVIAGEFTGNLTCRERLEAHASGRINGRVETFKLMLHEGASVEGEMHMITEAPRDASETIRGTAPLRGETKSEGKSDAPVADAAATATPSPATDAAKPASGTQAGKSVPTVAPSSSARPASAAASRPDPVAASPAGGASGSAASAISATSASGVADAAAPLRSKLAETLRSEALRVAPRATTSTRSSGSAGSGRTSSSGSRGRNGTTTTGF